MARSVGGTHRSPDDRPVNRLLKLADVAGPGVCAERGEHVRAQLDVPPIPTVELLEKERREIGNLFRALPQRRDPDFDHIEAAEILPEVVRISCLRLMHGGCDDAYIDPDDLATDGGQDLSRPEHAKEPGDEGAREGLDLVQVDRAMVGELKAPDPPPDRQGRRPLVMAE